MKLEGKALTRVLLPAFFAVGILSAFITLARLMEQPASEPPPAPLVEPSGMLLEEVPADEIPLPGDFRSPDLTRAVYASLRFLSGQDEHRVLPFGGDETVTVRRLKATLEAFLDIASRDLSAEAFREALLDNFLFFRPRRDDLSEGRTAMGPVLVTGYFQPMLRASRKKTKVFSYPLYAPPEDLVRISLGDFDPSLPATTLWGRVRDNRMIPYFDRTQIDRDHVLDRAPVLAWLNSPVDGLMLHIQGSGILQFEDGSKRHIHYAASNGRPYGSIGGWLIRQGILPKHEADWPGIRRWAEKHPDIFSKAIAANPRYIFFRWEKNGPYGSMGEVLIPMKSAALDTAVYPTGALFLLDTSIPSKQEKINTGARRRLFVLNQDTGSAIRGPARLDLYCGEGDEAGAVAGKMRQRGYLYMLLKKE